MSLIMFKKKLNSTKNILYAVCSRYNRVDENNVKNVFRDVYERNKTEKNQI